MDATRILNGSYVMLKLCDPQKAPLFLISEAEMFHCPPSRWLPTPGTVVSARSKFFVCQRKSSLSCRSSTWTNIPFSTIGEAVEQVFEGLHLLHNNNIWHGDCKYNSIMMDASHILVDFPYPWISTKTREYTRRPRPARSHTLHPVKYYWKCPQGFGVLHAKKFEGFEFMHELIADMCQEDPAKRPTMDEVVNGSLKSRHTNDRLRWRPSGRPCIGLPLWPERVERVERNRCRIPMTSEHVPILVEVQIEIHSASLIFKQLEFTRWKGAFMSTKEEPEGMEGYATHKEKAGIFKKYGPALNQTRISQAPGSSTKGLSDSRPQIRQTLSGLWVFEGLGTECWTSLAPVKIPRTTGHSFPPLYLRNAAKLWVFEAQIQEFPGQPFGGASRGLISEKSTRSEAEYTTKAAMFPLRNKVIPEYMWFLRKTQEEKD
ncbi:hypothetical protein FB451DRAFT_1190331 [Mycena latifolia]|nr:hypothetical protein FB451DRAFT_1190331 [Mycena latifolia]